MITDVHQCTLGRAIIAALLCVFIVGCATDMPPKIQTVEIAVPIPTPRACPNGLCHKFEAGPLPVFLTDPAHPDWVYLDAEGQKRLRDLVAHLKGRFEALRGWAVSP